jgi:type IV pilus assembly protein PilN
MTRINLLPWREARRKERERAFFIALGVAVAIALGVVGYAHWFMTELVDGQEGRNQFLDRKISELNRKIGEIARLEQERRKLLDRISIIQRLQASRPEVVHLFDELPRRIPEGVYLKSLKQSNRSITLQGIAQSNARVSSFMRNLDASDWLTNPQLKVITTVEHKRSEGLVQRVAEFTLVVSQVNPEAKKAREQKP